MLKLKQKSFLWWLTFPFAHNNFTIIGKTLYHPRGVIPQEHIIRHETVHVIQMEEIGTLNFYLLYLLCFPFFFNKWRWQFEFEAHKIGQKYDDQTIKNILGSYRYGWLREPTGDK